MRNLRVLLAGIIALVFAGCSSDAPAPELPYDDAATDGYEDIVYVGIDSNIYTVNPAGDNTVPVTDEDTDEETMTPNFSLPTWSPDGDKIAFTGFATEKVDDEGNKQIRSTIYIADSQEEQIDSIFSSFDTSPMYLYWAPNSETVSFASSYNDPEATRLSLQVVDAKGENHRRLVNGRPIYWAWSPDSSSIIANSGSGTSRRMRLVEPSARRGDAGDELTATPAAFQAPEYSPDGSSIVAATRGPDGDGRLVTMPAVGEPEQVITEVDAFVAFGWSPDSERIAYIDGRRPPMGGVRGDLYVVSPNPIPSTVSLASEPSQIPGGSGVIAFYWSPDGSKLAFFRPLPSTGGPQQVVMTLLVYDVETQETHEYGTFQASRPFAYQVLPRFDQYHRSATIWSPDSSKLLVSGMEDENTPAVYVVNLEDKNVENIAEGQLAFWRPGETPTESSEVTETVTLRALPAF